ncbi:tRNA-dihydrouridine synthase [Vibrio lentus]|nr:tRNA-dihydrouridine synthase [Vibrio lentus]
MPRQHIHVGCPSLQCSIGLTATVVTFTVCFLQQTLLYTEMVTTGAILHGKGDFLEYNEQEHPLALQRWFKPCWLAACAKLAGEH